ncbi:alginate lyase family protein [Formosa sp. PL04]|uniref:alginate lyase family protein n=1 Tax=Formosa sp. PL04 TaxID=3081755 RepID=UPI0029810EB3|nr:alginate lyase family protein [Formosa sp. PL04]MDW5290282.1 alginate lyase family protein [Formosa sp. PL04]
MKHFILILLCVMSFAMQAQVREQIGNIDFSDWSGVKKDKHNVGAFSSGKTISYRYPDGEKSYKGFKQIHGNASDWSPYAGVAFDIYLKKESRASVVVSFKVDESDTGGLNPVSTTNLQITGIGWQSVYIPWELFDLAEGQKGATLQAVKELEIKVDSDNNKSLKIRNVSVAKGEFIALEAPIQGKSVKAGGQVEYEVEVSNTTANIQNVQLQFTKYGWESMTQTVDPSTIELQPFQVVKCTVLVNVPDRLPEGVHENQVLKAIPNGKGNAAATLQFTTAVTVPAPNIVFTADKWQEVRDKMETYDWAKEGALTYEKIAQEWEVPKVDTNGPTRDFQFGQHLYSEKDANAMFNTAIAYQITGKKEYAEKCALFLKRFSSEENGYPTTWRAGGANFVKEGGFFQNIARGYDMIQDADLLTAEDQQLIENSFRLYIDIAITENSAGNIGNWDLSELAGAFYCALSIQDLYLAEELLTMPAGIYQQLAQGVLNDGWWHEAAIGYNLWCSQMFSQIAISLEPWGIDFKNKLMPLGTTPNHSLTPRRNRPGAHGMNFMKWGTLNNNNIGIKDMWDAALDFLDYRGVMFAVNDATETRVSGADYELAYYLYRDPEYAGIIGRGKTRDLLYGVPDLPEVTSEKASKSAYADNMGIVQLRSQTPDREQRDQIQAALHYGTHGGGHGHYDRTQLISMMRYGRSFYNPEMYWYGYSSYLYKFLVQASINKNMVVVDEKMQEPTESFKTLFYTGDMMQATAVESKSRWMNPPYMGMIYGGDPVTVEDKAWNEGRSLFIPEDHPPYGDVTAQTDSIMQRRVMVMMDDFIVLSDYAKSDSIRTYDWLMQIKGFKTLSADKKEFLRHDNQWSTDPLGAAQFTTDCDWYETTGTARSSFEMCFGEGCDNGGARMRNSEDGPLKIDVFNAWPIQNEIMIGTTPEAFSVEKKLWYTITADDVEVVNDSTSAWVLGSQDIKLDISGKKKLVLTTKTQKAKTNTIFWGDAKLTLKDGSEVLVSSLPLKYENILVPNTKGKDYYDGPIKIAGELMGQSTPGMPENTKESGTITIDISGLKAVEFNAKLGGDFPLGDESSRRKTLAVRTKGKETRYLSVIEPYETESVIKSVTAKNENELIVELLDGRIQEITIGNVESDSETITVDVKETLNGKVIREERTY